MKARRAASGFTLLEVLVALTVLSLSLMAALRASGNIARDIGELRQRQLADWVAENRLEEHRARRNWLNVGSHHGEAKQGGEHFRWEENVSGTPNSRFRRVEIRVRAAAQAENDAPLAKLVGFLARPSE
jgi:general secretion pathway protein I